MVIDSHTHAWGPPSEDHPWVNGPLVENALRRFSVDPVFRAESLRSEMDDAGIDAAIVVGYPVCRWTDNWYTTRVAREFDRLYGIVLLDPFAEDAAATLRQEMATDGVLGFRLGAICPYDAMWERSDPSVSWLRDAIAETAFWEAAAETDATVQVLIDGEQVDQALELVESYPDLTYLFDHFLNANSDETFGAGTYARLGELSAHDDVGIKISKVVHQSAESHPYADMHEHVRWLLDTFGRERVIWGSDFPNVSDEAEYAETLSWLDSVDSLSTGDRNWLAGRSLRRLVGI